MTSREDVEPAGLSKKNHEPVPPTSKWQYPIAHAIGICIANDTAILRTISPSHRRIPEHYSGILRPVSRPPIPSPVPPLRLTSTQWRALLAAWLGWAFDGLDGFLYIMVATPFVTQLVAAERGLTSQALRADPVLAHDADLKAALIQAVFLFGWAIGGAVFGRLGDRLGRSRTLTLTILTYACFTGLSFFAGRWWHLLIFRFVAALGIGGEWAAGSALVGETLHPRCRAWASATLQSGYMVGCICAALTTRWLSGVEPRYVFLVGIAPAFVTLWIRRAVPEPEEWRRTAALEKPPPVRAIFARDLLPTTILTILLTGIALTVVWAFWYFLPVVIRTMPEMQGRPAPEVQALVANVTIFSLLCNIPGNYFATYLARFAGYRAAFAILFAVGLACFLFGFARPLTMSTIYIVPGLTSFFILGVFGIFPLYIPALFPTLLRTLGAGVTYNIGRVISAVGTFATGALLIKAGGATQALWWIGLLYIPGILVALAAPRIPIHSPQPEPPER